MKRLSSLIKATLLIAFVIFSFHFGAIEIHAAACGVGLNCVSTVPLGSVPQCTKSTGTVVSCCPSGTFIASTEGRCKSQLVAGERCESTNTAGCFCPTKGSNVAAGEICPGTTANACPSLPTANTEDRGGNFYCKAGLCSTGKNYCVGAGGKIVMYQSCTAGNIGCGENGCTGQMSYCSGGVSACKADTACVGVSAPVTGTVGSCDGCSDEGSCAGRKGIFQFSSATYHPECAAQKGYCSGTTVCGGGSTSTAPVTGNLSCGDKCTTSADCRNPSANGAPVACVNGTCQNTLCAAGQTIPGANCSCGANTRKCGQTCSGALGLCAPGQGTCTYVNTSGPYCPWGWSQTYCAGSSNGYKRTACTTGDAPGGGYLVGPAGKTSGLTVAEITASCQVCGNGSIETGEYCDDGKLNGDATQCTCSKSCQLFSGSLLINGVSTPVSVARGSSVTLTWNTAGMAKCTASNGWTGDKSVKGTETITGVSANTQFDLLCTQASTGRPVTLSANVNITGTTPAPSIDFMINKSNDPVVTTKTVNWATQFAVFNAYFNWNTSGATTCVGYTTPSPQSVYPFPGTVPYVTTASNAGWFLFDKTQPVNLTSTTAALAVINDATAAKYGVFTLTCTGAGGKTSRTILVTTDVPATKSSCGAPVATPTPLPLVCSMLPTVKSTGNVNAWKIGDAITFGVAAASSTGIPTNSKIRYEGQVSAYRGNAQISTINLTPINATASQFMPMKVNAVNATYYYRFRYCVMSITNVETCSAWGAWTAPSGV